MSVARKPVVPPAAGGSRIVSACIAAVTLAAGLAAGFVIGSERGKGINRRERDEAVTLAEAASESRRQAEAELAAAKADGERDRAELNAVRAAREAKPLAHVRKWAVGDPVSVRNPRTLEGEFTYVFETYSALEDYAACRSANDEEGIRQLERRGRIVHVANGRPATVAKVVIDGATNPLYAVQLAEKDGKDGGTYLVHAEYLFPQKVADKLPHLNADIEDTRPRAEMDKANPFRPK